MTQVFGDIRAGLVLLTALAVSGAGWWLVVAEPETLPGLICGVAGYETGGLLIGRVVMWLAMMLAMALPVGVVIGTRAGRAPDAAFLTGYAGTAAGVAVVAAVVEWVMTLFGLEGDLLSDGPWASAIFMALGLLNVGTAALRRSSSCMDVRAGGELAPHPAAATFSPLKRGEGACGTGGAPSSLAPRAGRGWRQPGEGQAQGWLPLLPLGRSAEQMRGDEGFSAACSKFEGTPHPALRATFSPRGEARTARLALGLHQGRLSLVCSLTMVGLQLILGSMSLILMLVMILWMLTEALFPERRELPMALGAALVMAGLSVIAVISVT